MRQSRLKSQWQLRIFGTEVEWSSREKLATDKSLILKIWIPLLPSIDLFTLYMKPYLMTEILRSNKATAITVKGVPKFQDTWEHRNKTWVLDTLKYKLSLCVLSIFVGGGEWMLPSWSIILTSVPTRWVGKGPCPLFWNLINNSFLSDYLKKYIIPKGFYNN